MKEVVLEKNIREENTRQVKLKKMKTWKKIVIAMCILGIIGVSSLGFIFYGPFNFFRDWWITTAMTRMTHQYLATWLYNDDTISAEEKNSVYEQIKIINTNSGIEEKIESKVNETYKCNTFANIENTSVRVVVDECENSKSLANNIMRLVQEQFDSKMYISVQFED